ncbi:hypothetical protein AMECASPLE_011025 [Ameca splendens]|uniref:HECT domain-containing protein n=1 Tax=Ameca splendens TaxID=208324 RepID=A0ABV0ZM82_9TELE
MFWNDWLIEVDEGTRPVTLEQILVFVSGLNSIPPLGFPQRPTIEFLQCDDGSRKLYPEANTCEVTLHLPIHQTYDSFVHYMESMTGKDQHPLIMKLQLMFQKIPCLYKTKYLNISVRE